jgi:hypothetical protein
MIEDMMKEYAFEKYTDLEDKFDLKNEEPSEEFEEWIRDLFNRDEFYDWLIDQEEMEWGDLDENVFMDMINHFNQYYLDNFGREYCKITNLGREMVIENYAYVVACENTMDYIDYIKRNYEEESESDADTEVEEWNEPKQQ